MARYVILDSTNNLETTTQGFAPAERAWRRCLSDYVHHVQQLPDTRLLACALPHNQHHAVLSPGDARSQGDNSRGSRLVHLFRPCRQGTVRPLGAQSMKTRSGSSNATRTEQGPYWRAGDASILSTPPRHSCCMATLCRIVPLAQCTKSTLRGRPLLVVRLALTIVYLEAVYAMLHRRYQRYMYIN